MMRQLLAVADVGIAMGMGQILRLKQDSHQGKTTYKNSFQHKISKKIHRVILEKYDFAMSIKSDAPEVHNFGLTNIGLGSCVT